MKKEIEKFCKQYNLDISKVEMDSDGLYIYNDFINLSYKKIKKVPKALRHFKYIHNIDFFACRNLESLNGLENLVGARYLSFSNCKNLSDISTLKSLKNVHELIFNYCHSLKDISGLQNLINVDYLNFTGCYNLKSFKGLEKCKVNIKYFYPEERLSELFDLQYSYKELGLSNTIQQALNGTK